MTSRSSPQANGAPPPPLGRLSLGIVGHREDNPSFAANRWRIETVLDQIFDTIAALIAAEPPWRGHDLIGPVRLHSMLADGADQLAAVSALGRGWELVAPLPFGQALNIAINARPASAAEARALLTGGPGVAGDFGRRADAIRRLGEAARVFELADADERIAALFLAGLEAPADLAAAQRFAVHCAQRVALAARVLIEQSDIIIGIWDGASRAFVGGTGHTIAAALDMGAAVVWIDANAPEDWRILRVAESLVHAETDAEAERESRLAALVRGALRPDSEPVAGRGAAREALKALAGLPWRARSNPLFHAYRRIEALFGGEAAPFQNLRRTYEPPEAIATGSGAGMLAAIRGLPGGDGAFAARVEVAVVRRFAWADGISTHFSDLYRGAMTASFLLSALAITSGVAYLPFVTADRKWLFALVELGLLGGILAVTAFGRRRNWHARWFETRRVAEYLRHGPTLLALGVARPAGRWPRGIRTSWPEWYARLALREVGLPRLSMSHAYLRAALGRLLDEHVVRQRDYHKAKARRLHRVHRNLDHLSLSLFLLAVISAAVYLLLRASGVVGLVPEGVPHALSKLLTFLGVLFPTFGAAIAGVRYFGDFERFAAISEVTAEKLAVVHARGQLLLAAPWSALDYGCVNELAHAMDEIVVQEIENWQAVFGGKHIALPA